MEMISHLANFARSSCTWVSRVFSDRSVVGKTSSATVALDRNDGEARWKKY